MTIPLNRRAVLAGLCATAAAGPALAATSDMAGDIDILERAYTQLHPGLYRYATPDAMARRFAQLRTDFARAPTLQARYKSLSLFLASIRCGHTYGNFYNQTASVQQALFSGKTRLPFHFRLLGDRIIVTRSQTAEPRLVPGAEILRIDGRSPRDLIRALTPYMRADGNNDAKRRALMDVRGLDRFESFDVYYPLEYSVGDAFALTLRRPGQTRVERVEVEPIDLATRRTAMAVDGTPGGATPAWTLTERDGVAILTMPTWSLYNSQWDWRRFLDDAFAQIFGARGLIVDLRGNEGGLDCGNAIIARLIDRDLALTADERRVRFRTTPADLNPYLDTWDRSFEKLGEGADDLGDGFYRLKAVQDVNLITPKGPRFRAPVVVLIDAQNSSATFQFAQIVQTNGLGRLMGSPTGGNQRGINGGAFFFLRLPQSGLEADLPLIGRFPVTPKPDAGLEPDFALSDTAADIAAGRDAVLDGAVRRLKV